MELWLDTINLQTVADAAKKGMVAGVTTNPAILAQTRQVPETLLQLLRLQPGPVAVQVTSPNPEEMIEEARAIFDFSDRMIVKVPVDGTGLIAIRQLCAENIPVMGTGIFHPTQALLAAQLGAAYIAPYFSYLGEAQQATETLNAIIGVIKVNHSATKVLVASLRQLEDIATSAFFGADAATLKDELYQKLMSTHPLLEKCNQTFTTEWKRTHKNSSIKDLLSGEALANRV